MESHAAVAAELLEDENLVAGAIRDLETSRLSGAEKELLRFIDRVNRESPAIGPADIRKVKAAGWTEEAIYDALTVCALFNFYNRWIDATGVHAMTKEAHRAGAKRMRDGYVRSAGSQPNP